MRRPVTLCTIPDNGRDDFPLAGDTYVRLPIEMPKYALVILDEADAPVNISTDKGPIRPEDLATVWEGINQYNDDVAALAGREAGAEEP
jgi:hypothetical protein